MAGNEMPVDVTAKKKINTEIYWLLGIFALAITLRIIVALTRGMVWGEAASQLRMADNLLLGIAPDEITGSSATAYGILYPLITASFGVMLRDITVAGYATSIVFGSLLILPAYLFGKVMWNRRVATAAAALVAVLPLLVSNGALTGQQSVFAFWLACGMFFGYRMQFTKRCMCGMLSGTCLGLAYLVDTSALYFVIALFTLLVIIGLRQEMTSYAGKAALQFLVTFLVFAIPNVAWMSYMNGDLTILNRPADSVYASVNGLQPGSLSYEKEVLGLDDAGGLRLNELRSGNGFFATLVQEPVDTVKAVARDGFDFYFNGAQTLIPVWLLPLLGVGIFSSVWTRREALKYGFFLLMLLPALVMPVIWHNDAFVLPFLAILLVGIGKGWVYLEDWSSDTLDELAGWQNAETGHKQAVIGILAVLVLAPLAALSIYYGARADYPTEYRVAGEWIKGQGGEDVRIMSRESASSWYAGADQVVLPFGTVDEVVGYGRANDADYLVVSSGLIEDLRPWLAPLLDPDKAPDGLEAAYISDEGTGEELIVYRYK